jgi:hypothetical protein
MPEKLHEEFSGYMKTRYGKGVVSRTALRLLFKTLSNFEQAEIAFSPRFSYTDLLQRLYADEPYVSVPAVFVPEELSLLTEIRNACGIACSDLLRLAMLSVLHPEGSKTITLKSFASSFYGGARSFRFNFQLYNEVIDLFNDTTISSLHIQKFSLFRASSYYFDYIAGSSDCLITSGVSRFTLSPHSWVIPATSYCASFYRRLKEKTGFTGAMLSNLSLYHFLSDIKTGAAYA